MRRTLLSSLTGDAEIEALLSDAEQLRAMLQFEAALAEAEAAAGLISNAAAQAIAVAVERFDPDWDRLAGAMARDGVVVPELVRQLRAATAEPHRQAVHLGATSQDAIDTALMLQLRRIIPILTARASQLHAQLQEIAVRDGSRSLMAHTRMQAALPFTVGDKLRSWSEPLERHREAIAAASDELLAVQLGGPIGDRSSFGGKGDDVAAALAARLGLRVAPSWHQMRDPVLMFGARLAALTGSLGKIGADIALMAQTEVGAVALANGGTSSAMAHKSNPVQAEILVALARYSAGLLGALGQSMVHEGERSGAAWTLEWLTLPTLIVNTGAALSTAQQLVGQLSFSPMQPPR